MDILIVDDESITRKLLSNILKTLGHSPVEAQNGRLAMEAMQKQTFHFVITDWMMPEMDGLELCRQIRQANWGRYVYVIVLTAKDEKCDLLEVFQAGADDYLPKPFDLEVLKARLQTGLRVVELEKYHMELQLQLKDSWHKLSTVFDALEEQIVSLDPEMKIVSANKVFLDRAGILADKVVGTTGVHFFDNAIEQNVKKVFETGEKMAFLYQKTDSQSEPCFYQVVCLPIISKAEKIDQVIVVSKDVTEERRKADEIQTLNQELQHSTDKLKQKNKKLEKTLESLEETQSHMLQSEKMASIGQLAAGVAHEINNPTGFVSSNLKTLSDYMDDVQSLFAKYQGLCQALMEDGHPETLRQGISENLSVIASMEKDIDVDFVLTDISDLVGDCREGTDRIKKIVADLKDFAHPGNEERQLVDINKGLESTLNVVNNEIKYKAVVKKSLGEIPVVLGFPQQLNQVFMNILVNAAQAIEENGEIHIDTNASEDWIEIAIKDTGCGIGKKHLSKIFDPFFTTKDVGQGTGLGMHIAYNIIQKHQGQIKVKSRVGEGTVFTIRLPAASMEEEIVS